VFDRILESVGTRLTQSRSTFVDGMCIMLRPEQRHIFRARSNSTPQGGAASPAYLNPDLLKEFCWRMVGPAMPSGRVWTVVGVESDPKTIYAGTAGGVVWKTTNHGTTWKPIFEHEGSSSIGAIAVAKQNPNIAWVGTGEPASVRSNRLGDGVYKSTDGGETWTNMGLSTSLPLCS
jgi:hypothetical protein